MDSNYYVCQKVWIVRFLKYFFCNRQFLLFCVFLFAFHHEQELFSSATKIPKTQIFPAETSLPLNECAQDYEKKIVNNVPEAIFDLVLLGLFVFLFFFYFLFTKFFLVRNGTRWTYCIPFSRPPSITRKEEFDIPDL